MAETLNLSQLQGYRTGGTVHICHQQTRSGFTTSPHRWSRARPICTGIAKMLGVPIFHVNGDDPIAAVSTIQLAFEFRQKFHKERLWSTCSADRRHGHNEGDEPRFTQPLMYSAIEDHPPISDIFFGHSGQVRRHHAGRSPRLPRRIRGPAERRARQVEGLDQDHRPRRCASRSPRPACSIPSRPRCRWKRCASSARRWTKEPANLTINPKVKRWLATRKDMIEGKTRPSTGPPARRSPSASLLASQIPVRLSGQDSRRVHLHPAPCRALRQ